MPDWLLYILWTLGSLYLTLLRHEFSHCAAAWTLDMRVTGFYPWPHIKDGRFFFGRMTWETQRVPTTSQLRGLAVAPITSSVISCLVMLTMGLAIGNYLLLITAATEFTDIINWVQGYLRNSGNDGGKYRRNKRTL